MSGKRHKKRCECWGSKSWPMRKHTLKFPLKLACKFGNAFFSEVKKDGFTKGFKRNLAWILATLRNCCFFDKELHSEPCSSTCCHVCGRCCVCYKKSPNLWSNVSSTPSPTAADGQVWWPEVQRLESKSIRERFSEWSLKWKNHAAKTIIGSDSWGRFWNWTVGWWCMYCVCCVWHPIVT